MRAAGGSSAYAQKALTDELATMREATEGHRNPTLNGCAFNLGQLVARGWLAQPLVEDRLRVAARGTGLTDGEITRTLRSGIEAGIANPRPDPPPLPEPPAPTELGSAGAAHVDGGGGAPDQVADKRAYLESKLLYTDTLDSIPPPRPLIKDVLYSDSTTWLSGLTGSYKSFVALDMAGCIATGTSWQGHEVTQAPVLYLVAEGASGIRKRVRAWEKAMGQPMTGVAILPVTVQSTSESDWQAFVDLAASHAYGGLVVVDTQARVTVGMEENSAKEMGVFVERCEQLKAAIDGCVMPVHHWGRNGEHMRGNSALDAAANTEIHVVKQDRRVTVRSGKQKDHDDFPDIELEAVTVDLPGGEDSLVLVPGGPSVDGVNLEEAAKTGREWWNVFEDDWVSITKLTKAEVAPERTLYRHVKKLEKSGLALPLKRGKVTYYRLTRKP